MQCINRLSPAISYLIPNTPMSKSTIEAVPRVMGVHHGNPMQAIAVTHAVNNIMQHIHQSVFDLNTCFPMIICFLKEDGMHQDNVGFYTPYPECLLRL